MAEFTIDQAKLVTYDLFNQPSIMFSHENGWIFRQKCVDFTTSPPNMTFFIDKHVGFTGRKNVGLKGILSNQTCWKQRTW
jgi:hypothetical protein